MSGKRRAFEQIIKETAYDDRDDDDDNDQELNAPKQASAEVLSTRKILKPRGFKGAASFIPKKPSPLVTNTSLGNDNSLLSDKNSKIKLLNIKFIEALVNAKDINPIGDLRPILNKYNSYYEQIQIPLTTSFTGFIKNDTPVQEDKPKPNPFAFLLKPVEPPAPAPAPILPVVPTPAPVTKPTEPTEVIDDSGSDSDSDDDIKVEGPKFTLDKPPTTKNSVFTFGAKPKPEIEFSDSDSDDDIKVEGPKFTLNTNPSDNKSFFGGFKLSKPAETEKKDEEEPKKPLFSFGAPLDSEKPLSNPFAFSPPAEKKLDDKPAFSFTAKELEKPTGFSFGAPLKETELEKPKPSFSFGALLSLLKESETKPAFSFSQPDSSLPKFLFNSSEPKEDKPSFSFGAAAAALEKPAPFSFSQSNATTETKPFSFSASTTESAKPFSFKGNDTTTAKPAFSFGQSLTTEPKPAFSFGATDSDKSKTNFTSSFNFNNGATGGSVFNFSPNPMTASSSTAATTGTATDEPDNDKVEEHEPNVDFKPVVKLDHELEVTTGEEDETAKCSKRCKLMLLADKEYQTKGIGEFRVLFNNKTSKSRVLLRAEGSLRVILNSLIHKDFKFEKIGTKGNMIKFPTVNGEGQLETYVIQVKTATDGDELLSAIEEGKS